MLKHFLCVWLIYWIAVALLPVYSISPATIEAFMLQVVFVLLVMFGYKLALAIWHVPPLPKADGFSIPGASKLIWISLLISFIGLLSLTYDKIYLQGIDYSEGFAVARQAWRKVGEARGGRPSSIFSALGYLLGSAYFVTVILTITQARFISSYERFSALLASFALLLGNAALTGGRSNILLLAAFAVGTFSSRRGLRLQDLLTSSFQRGCLKLLSAFAAVYMVFIFYQRAEAGGSSALEYALGFMPYLGIQPEEWYLALLDNEALDALGTMLILALAYITHSFATVAAIIDEPREDKVIVFLYAFELLSKLGLWESPDGAWFLSGRFPSAPGALWYQFGGFGFFVYSFLLGVGSALAKIWTTRKPYSVLALGTYVAATAILLLTPILFAWEFLAFPFILTAFIMMAACARCMLPGIASLERFQGNKERSTLL